MSDMGARLQREIRKQKWIKKQKAKKQGPSNPNLSSSQFPKETNLSRMYDNDGNPVEREPRGYTKFGGH